MARPTFHLIAGPNGAGKTTFYEQWLSARTRAAFVNPDLLVREALGRWSRDRDDVVLGQELAQAKRQALMAKGQDLVMETTFSHPSKLDLVDEVVAAGYRLVVYHLSVVDAAFAVERVADREVLGGHPVPPKNVRERYARNGPLIRQAVLKAHHGYVFDNSVDGRPPRLLIQLAGGAPVRIAADLPAWARELYLPEIGEG